MAKRIIAAAKLVRERLHYNQKTGKFKSLVVRDRIGRRRYPAEVGHVARDGYVRVYLGSKQYLAHRLAWLWMTGRWPKKDIDHKNRKRSDNRWCNLRDVTRAKNCRNNKLQGRAGISWDEPGPGRTGAWKVYIWRAKVGNIHIGRYKSKVKALKIAKLLCDDEL